MTTSAIAKAKDWKTRLSLAAPGLAARFRYEGSNLSHDMVAGLSVVADAEAEGAIPDADSA